MASLFNVYNTPKGLLKNKVAEEKCSVHNMTKCERCGQDYCTNCREVFAILPDKDGVAHMWGSVHECDELDRLEKDLKRLRKHLVIINYSFLGIFILATFLAFTSNNRYVAMWDSFLAGLNLMMFYRNIKEMKERDYIRKELKK